MPVNLSIKGVPDALAKRLRARAERNHRSLQGELMAIVERAAFESDEKTAPAPEKAEHASARTGTKVGFKTIEEIYAEHVARFPEPIRGGPLAVDIIRADRDSR